jgi:hypothetical protein
MLLELQIHLMVPNVNSILLANPERSKLLVNETIIHHRLLSIQHPTPPTTLVTQ